MGYFSPAILSNYFLVASIILFITVKSKKLTDLFDYTIITPNTDPTKLIYLHFIKLIKVSELTYFTWIIHFTFVFLSFLKRVSSHRTNRQTVFITALKFLWFHSYLKQIPFPLSQSQGVFTFKRCGNFHGTPIYLEVMCRSTFKTYS